MEHGRERPRSYGSLRPAIFPPARSGDSSLYYNADARTYYNPAPQYYPPQPELQHSRRDEHSPLVPLPELFVTTPDGMIRYPDTWESSTLETERSKEPVNAGAQYRVAQSHSQASHTPHPQAYWYVPRADPILHRNIVTPPVPHTTHYSHINGHGVQHDTSAYSPMNMPGAASHTAPAHSTSRMQGPQNMRYAPQYYSPSSYAGSSANMQPLAYHPQPPPLPFILPEIPWYVAPDTDYHDALSGAVARVSLRNAPYYARHLPTIW